MAVQQPGKCLCKRDGRDDIDFITHHISTLSYPIVFKLYFDPHPKRFFSAYSPAKDLFHPITVCQVTQNFHIQPLP